VLRSGYGSVNASQNGRPVSETIDSDRLRIRAFVADDLPAIHRILDATLGDGTQGDDPAALEERRSWLEWQRLNQVWLPRMKQPPYYGDRAVVLKATGRLIGAVGYVPLLAPFEQIPELDQTGSAGTHATTEAGLFWAIDPAHQRRGYATEAARALVDHAFQGWRLKRIVATTDYDNVASQGVMRKLGMTITRNPRPEPAWLQVVGLLWNDRP
jgi:RimJ/RimL family protein N-acetyltransferase